jgi:hypothetical protein
MINTVQMRQVDLELALAAACEVQVQRIPLYNKRPVALWDFRHADELISEGYEIACQEIALWQVEQKRGWLARLLHPN